jgi:phosphopantetheinyl transferase
MYLISWFQSLLSNGSTCTATLWFLDPSDASDPELLAEYTKRCMTAEEAADLCKSEMAEGARVQRIHAKAFTRCVLARYCGGGVAPTDLKFTYGDHGKPSLAGIAGGSRGSGGSSSGKGKDEAHEEQSERSAGASVRAPPPLRFSLSHCSKLVVLAVTTAPPGAVNTAAGAASPPEAGTTKQQPFAALHEVGVDAEDELRRTSAAADRLARRWLSPAEAASLARVPEAGQRELNITFCTPFAFVLVLGAQQNKKLCAYFAFKLFKRNPTLRGTSAPLASCGCGR